MSDTWVGEILHFWFHEIAREAWFRSGDDLDRRLRERFLERQAHVASLALAGCRGMAPAALAAAIALDQFPRNMFRGTLRAFATDAKAREVAEAAIRRSFDRALSKDQRMFLYLPFEHAEDKAAQARAVELMASL